MRVTCRHCARVRDVPASNAGRYKYCSVECRKAALSTTSPCRRCGKPVRYPIAHPRTHCSEACYRPTTLYTCLTCGVTKRCIPSKIRRYCSRACYVRSGAETVIEQRVREQLERLGVAYASEVKCGPFVVDFVISDLAGHVAIEADGDYWHARRPEIDARKNARLAAAGYEVWRLGEAEINDAGFAVAFEARVSGRLLHLGGRIRGDVNAPASSRSKAHRRRHVVPVFARADLNDGAA